MHKKIHRHLSFNRSSIDKDALSIIQVLQQAGFIAYLVGGGVRDLFLGFPPKDFDISTSARPDEIKKLFRHNCLLIGRRFRLAHIRYGRKIFEVSTFRSGDSTTDELITHDNVWGSEEEDVLRRDFTMNALFYDPFQEIVIDYVGGVEDVKKGLLRTVGDPQVRFRQDPVRMIRLLKFLARFHFHCDSVSQEAIRCCRYDIVKSAHARVLEEILTMLESGASAAFFEYLHEYGLLEFIFPCFSHFFCHHRTKTLLLKYLHSADTLKITNRDVLVAALIYPFVEEELMRMRTEMGAITYRASVTLIESLIYAISTSSFVHFPKRMVSVVSFIIINQLKLTPHKGSPRFTSKFASSEEARNALALLHIRTHVDLSLEAIFQEWNSKI